MHIAAVRNRRMPQCGQMEGVKMEKRTGPRTDLCGTAVVQLVMDDQAVYNGHTGCGKKDGAKSCPY